MAVSVIVPALREAENLPVLAERVHAALTGYLQDRPYELIIVDDNSQDGTDRVCAELATKYHVSLLVRLQPTDGLSGAVLHGMTAARGQVLVVMDADLQHPPECLPLLIGTIERGEGDFSIGSRYMPGGSTQVKWGFFRRLNSRLATMLARPFAGRTHDPMSGFFALSRATYQSAQRLTPLGYKIALELMCKCRVRNVREIPIQFGLRTRGQSKLSVSEQFRYLEHLSRLYDFAFPRLSPILKFLIATATSWTTGFLMFAALLSTASAQWNPHGFAMAATCSYAMAIAALVLFHARYVRTQRPFLITQHPWLEFFLISASEWITCGIAAYWLAARLDRARPAETFILSYFMATATRYLLRKELMQDVRGLRKDLRKLDLEEP